MAASLGVSAAMKILSTAVGLASSKVYDGVADHFKDGDVADESIHETIVRDLNDIKSKLECLSLKDLDSSYSFLEEGVQLLNLVLDTSSKDEKESPSYQPRRRTSNDIASGILKKSSSVRRAIQELNIFSKKRFLSAKGRFRESREEATRAFNNQSLSTGNRIMACKLRVAATILESGLEDPQVAVAACLVSLKDLHGLPGVQHMFSVFLKGGFMSWLKTEERLENIMSVLSVNHAIFDFASKHNSEYPDAFNWPGVQLKHRVFNPILNVRDILEKTSSREEFSRPLSRIVIDERMGVHYFAVNSQSEIVLLEKDRIRIIKTTGECKDVMLRKSTEIMSVMGIAVAVDSSDNVYAVKSVLAHDGNGVKRNLVFDAFDANYNLKNETALVFLDVDIWKFVEIAVDKNGNVIMIQKGDNQVYICDRKGQLKFQFERDSIMAYSLSITNNNDIMIPSDDQRNVHLYTTEGNLKSTIETPEGHKIWKVAFHHGTSELFVLTYIKELEQLSLLCYSETGELENSDVLCDDRTLWCDIKSHPSGQFAALFVEEQYLVYLRL